MVTDAQRHAIYTALRRHEIGTDTPYRLSFAKRGQSGGSFGAMQGDLAAHQDVARDAFRKCLTQAGFTATDVDRLIGMVGVHCPENPLSREETGQIDAALAKGHAIVDDMDAAIFQRILADVEHCIAVAHDHGRTLSDEALLAIAMWINMTGAPTKLLLWLQGQDPQLVRPIGPAPALIDWATMQNYLHACKYYVENPGNFAHLVECVGVGMNELHR